VKTWIALAVSLLVISVYVTASSTTPSAKMKADKGKLRSVPTELDDTDVESMFEKHNLFAKKWNNGDYVNEFVDNNDGTVTDLSSGLMWEKGGSSSVMLYGKTEEYISHLNQKKFLGHDDWRIPTLPELLSLLEPKPNEKGQFINPLFGDTQVAYWTSDITMEGNQYSQEMYVVNFTEGKFNYHQTDLRGVKDTSSGVIPESFFVKAVRIVR